MGQIRKITAQTQNRFLNLYMLDTVKKTGNPGRYFVASRAERPEDLKAVTHNDRPDAAVMYGITRDRQRILLIRQYRYAVDGFVYEFPAGLVDEGETAEETAVREVLEETGLTFEPVAADPLFTAPRYTTVGMTDECSALLFGYVSGEISDRLLEETEEIQVVLADRREARRILSEEPVAASCAYHLARFLTDEDPFGFLKQSLP